MAPLQPVSQVTSLVALRGHPSPCSLAHLLREAGYLFGDLPGQHAPQALGLPLRCQPSFLDLAGRRELALGLR